MSIGAVNVPIYATNSSEEVEYILKNSEAKLCFAGTAEHLDKLLKEKKKLPKVKNLIIFDDLPKKKASVLSLNDCYTKGESYKSKKNFEKRMDSIKSTDMATIIYTSGTTGAPKGVMLTHNNFISNLVNVNNYKV